MGLRKLFIIYLSLHIVFTASSPHNIVMHFIVNSIDSYSWRNVLRLRMQTIQIVRDVFIPRVYANAG